MFWPALACLAQELPRHDETPAPLPSSSPNASATSATPTPIPIPPSAVELIPPPAGTPALPAPSMPDLSQLDQIFKQTLPGKEAAEYRAHVEWRELKNRTVNDPAVVAAKAAAEAATTDLEKRNRLRIYYEHILRTNASAGFRPWDGRLFGCGKTSASRCVRSTAGAPTPEKRRPQAARTKRNSATAANELDTGRTGRGKQCSHP